MKNIYEQAEALRDELNRFLAQREFTVEPEVKPESEWPKYFKSEMHGMLWLYFNPTSRPWIYNYDGHGRPSWHKGENRYEVTSKLPYAKSITPAEFAALNLPPIPE